MPSGRFLRLLLNSSGARHRKIEGLANDVLYSVLCRSIRESYGDMLGEDDTCAMALFISSCDEVPPGTCGQEMAAYSRQIYAEFGYGFSFEAFDSRFGGFLRTLDRHILDAIAPKLVELPRRKFGEPGIGELPGLKVPEELSGYMISMVKAFPHRGVLTGRDVEYLTGLIEKIASAPGYLRYLDRDRKSRETSRLYHIVRRLKTAGMQDDPVTSDLLVSLGILLFNISRAQKIVAFLSSCRPSAASIALRYQHSAILAMNHLISGRPDLARAYAEIALEAAADPDKKAYVYVLQGCIAMMRGDYDGAVSSLQAGAAIPGLRRRLRGMIAFYTGVVRFEKGEYVNAIACFEAAGMQVSDALDQVTIHNNIGSCAMQIGDDARADQEFRAVEKLSLGLKGAQASQCMLMVSSYRSAILGSRGDSAKAAERYRKALKLASGRGDYKAVADLLGNLGVAHARSGDHLQAQQAFEACMTSAEHTGYWAGIRFAYWHLCHTLRETDSARARLFREKYTAKYPELRDL